MKPLEYKKLYGEVPKDLDDRVIGLLKEGNLKNKDLKKLKDRLEDVVSIDYSYLSFVFYFVPKATPRPRLSRFTNTFYVKGAMENSKLFEKYVKSQEDLNFKICTPCEFVCKSYFPIPNGLNRIDRILAELGLIKNIAKPDWDNLGKSHSDMIQKHLILDDSLIYDGRSIKAYSSKPRVEIYIKYMNEFDSNYNRNKVMNWKAFDDYEK